MKENKMGYQPVNSLLVSMSVPIMFSMLISALYNIVDSMFVAQVSEDALTAVSLAFPYQSLMIAVGVGTGVGVNSLLARSLGEKKMDVVKESASNGIFLGLCSYAVFALLALFFSKSFIAMQTNSASIISQGDIYIKICGLLSFGLFMQLIFEKLLTATGKTILMTIMQASGAIINIILDPIFIFGYFGLPAMGVSGAAIATVIGQIIGALIGYSFNKHKNHEIQLSMSRFKPNWHIIKLIYEVGFPSIIMQSIGSVMTFCMNNILITFSTTATALFGVYFKLQSFVFMPIFGLNNGMVPIAAFNYGARQPHRVMKAFKLAALYATGIMIIGFLIFQIFPDKLLMIFNPSEHMLEIGVPALRIISIHFVVAGYSIICSAFFQALGKGMYSMYISILRQLVVLIPAAWLLAKLNNIHFVWLSFPIAEVISMLLCTYFLIRTYKKYIAPMMEQTSQTARA